MPACVTLANRTTHNIVITKIGFLIIHPPEFHIFSKSLEKNNSVDFLLIKLKKPFCQEKYKSFRKSSF